MLYFPLESTALYFLFLYIFQIFTHEIRTHPDARMLLLLCQAVMQDSYGFHISGGTVFRPAMQRLRPILLLTAHPVTYNFLAPVFAVQEQHISSLRLTYFNPSVVVTDMIHCIINIFR